MWERASIETVVGLKKEVKEMNNTKTTNGASIWCPWCKRFVWTPDWQVIREEGRAWSICPNCDGEIDLNTLRAVPIIPVRKERKEDTSERRGLKGDKR
jgi:hypothetical protein